MTDLQDQGILLISEELNLAELHNLEGYCERKYLDAIYYGQIINGKRNGKGAMRYANGR